MKKQISLIASIIICIHMFGQTNTIKVKKSVNNSKVVYFNYNPCQDTICAFFYGNIYEINSLNNSKDSLLPLINVKIKAEQNIQTTLTDKNGKFSLNLPSGVYSLLIIKEGYEPLRITNYVSSSTEVAYTQIVLTKGKDLQTFKAPLLSSKWIR
ncbi:MAG: carboxypeptidase-like regulatory domain-containing protein [Bacteroidota bacterium]